MHLVTYLHPRLPTDSAEEPVFDAAPCYRGLQRPRTDFFSRVFRKKKLLQEIAALEATVGSDYETLVEMINTAAEQVGQRKSAGIMSYDSKKEE